MIRVDEEFIPVKQGFAKKYRLQEVLTLLGDPEKNLPTINIVGTNGKGSTSFYLSKGLLTKYSKVGLFISPAFLYQNERIQINNQVIGDTDLKSYLKKITPYINEYHLTFFEVWTLIAILYFVDQKVEIVVMEAGIGGMLDATNLMSNQIATLLTAVDFDHMEVLGYEIESILNNKILIAKPNTKLYISNDNQKWTDKINEITNQLDGVGVEWAEPIVDKIAYQQGNKGLVKSFLQDWNINDLTCLNLDPPLGRFTILQTDPLVVIDGAHNDQGMTNLITSFQKQYPHKTPQVLAGFSYTKGFENNIQLLNKTFKNQVHLTEFDHFKTWTVPLAYQNFKVNDWKDFLNQNLAAKNDIIICGSLYFIPQVYEWFQQKKKEK